MTASSEIPWDELRTLAREAAARSYAPYSKVRVGAAGFTDEATLVSGSNVENASYGLTLCAECSLISDFVSRGGGRLRGVSIVAGDGRPLAPCGRCRQLLFEHGGENLLVDAGAQSPARPLRELLPDAFGPDELGRRRSE